MTEPLASHPQLSGNTGAQWTCLESIPPFLWCSFVEFHFLYKAEFNPFACHLSSFPPSPPPLAQSTQKCSKCLMNQAGGIQMQATLIIEPSMRQELCLGSIRYWRLLNPQDDSVTVPARLGD